jgi:hypothetical protein
MLRLACAPCCIAPASLVSTAGGSRDGCTFAALPEATGTDYAGSARAGVSQGGTMHRFARVTAILLLAGVAPRADATLDFSFAADISGGTGNYSWSVSIEGAAAVPNPPIYLRRGSSYSLSVTAYMDHPFWIKTDVSTGSANSYDSGLSANGVTMPGSMITFNVPTDAPDLLYYDCEHYAEMHGPIYVVILRNGFE